MERTARIGCIRPAIVHVPCLCMAMIEPRIKGLAVINVRNWFDERLGSGWFLRAAREHDPDWPERLLPGEWYPARTCFAVYRHGYEQLGAYDSMYTMTAEISGEMAIKDLSGILRAFLWVASPTMFLRTTPRMWNTYNNFATPAVIVNETGRFVAHVGDIPPDLIEWVEAAWRGFLVPALKLAGGKDPKVSISNVQQSPGVETWEFLYELTYAFGKAQHVTLSDRGASDALQH
jgi:hypothetical protein